jgi:hypothetical protein
MTKTNSRIFSALLLTPFLVYSSPLLAHIKWFVPFDANEPPRHMGEVLSPTFAALYVISIVFIYVFFWLDRYFYRDKYLSHKIDHWVIHKVHSQVIIRASISIFYFCLFLYGRIFHNYFLLTPELQTELVIVPWLQLLSAITLMYRPTVPLAGVATLALFAIGMQQYGIHHMLDYMMFLGLAVYFLLFNIHGERAVTTRYVFLFASVGLSLLWGAVAKWAYPQWSYQLLLEKPALLMGMEPEFYMVLAGFVEFVLTFILFSSTSVFARIIALGFNLIFIVAIYEFGLIDAVGHLLIITVLLILTLRGPTRARYFLVLSNKSLWVEAYFMTGLYILAINVIFLAFYGLYFATY